MIARFSSSETRATGSARAGASPQAPRRRDRRPDDRLAARAAMPVLRPHGTSPSGSCERRRRRRADRSAPALLDSKAVMRELKVTRAAAERIMRQSPIVPRPDSRKAYIARDHPAGARKLDAGAAHMIGGDNADAPAALCQRPGAGIRRRVPMHDEPNAATAPPTSTGRTRPMASAFVVRRETKSGPRFHVATGSAAGTRRRARRQLRHAERRSAAARPRHCRARRRPRPPRSPTSVGQDGSQPTQTIRQTADAFLASRLDIDENTKKNYRARSRRSSDDVRRPRPATITADDDRRVGRRPRRPR